MNGLSCGIRIWAQFSLVLSQITRLTDGQSDRQTDRRTDSFLVVRPRCMHCSYSYNVRLFLISFAHVPTSVKR